MANGNNTFLKITNRNIYDKLVKIEERLDENQIEMTHFDERIKNVKWMSGIAIAIALACAGAIKFIK